VISTGPLHTAGIGWVEFAQEQFWACRRESVRIRMFQGWTASLISFFTCWNSENRVLILLYLFFLLLRHGDMAFYMYQRGAIDESRLRSALGPVQFDNPLVRPYWDENKRFFANEYRDYIDDLMRSHDLESSSQ